MIRKALFWAHLIGGIAAGLVIAVKSVTGIMLAYEHQLVDWAERKVQNVAVPADGRRVDVEAMVAGAKTVNPEQKFSGITVKSEPGKSAAVSFGRGGKTIFVNPYTGQAVGEGSKIHDAMHKIEDFHRWFNFKPVGRPISGAATFIFFFISLSGIYLWWPNTWTKSKLKSITVFNGKLFGKARDWNWHNVFGFWTMPLLAVISLTGVIMSYQWANDLVYKATGNKPPPPQQQANADAAKPVEPPMAGLNTLFATAEKKVQGWVTISLRLPQRPGGPVTATILEKEFKSGIPQRSQLSMNAATAEETKWEPVSAQNSGRRARTWARYLHTGEAGGIIGQTIALLAAVASLFLVWTGFALTWRRYRNWRANKKSQNVSVKNSAAAAELIPS